MAHASTGANVSKKRDPPQMYQLNDETNANPELTFSDENCGEWLVPYQEMTASVHRWQPQPKLDALLPLPLMTCSLHVAAISTATAA